MKRSKYIEIKKENESNKTDLIGGSMDRDKVLEVLENDHEKITYRYTNREEFNEAFAVAKYDIKAMQELIKIIEGDLKGVEWEEAILQVIQRARRIAR